MAQSKRNKPDESKTYAFLATFLSIIGFFIALLTKKNDKYVMHYAKQSLVLFIGCIIVAVISSILHIVPILGTVVSWILNVILLILWILSWVYALSGEIKYIPVIGTFGDKIKL
jgi:uncharacterized membrane protein